MAALSVVAAQLMIARQLGVWFHRIFTEPRFAPGPFDPPSDPTDATNALQAECARVAAEAARATALLDRLDQATRARAFRGALLANGHA